MYECRVCVDEIGPGEAKGELKKLMKQNNRGDRVAVIESADKMTDRQVAAKVRRCYTIENER